MDDHFQLALPPQSASAIEVKEQEASPHCFPPDLEIAASLSSSLGVALRQMDEGFVLSQAELSELRALVIDWAEHWARPEVIDASDPFDELLHSTARFLAAGLARLDGPAALVPFQSRVLMGLYLDQQHVEQAHEQQDQLLLLQA
jgi:hypothetical protein